MALIVQKYGGSSLIDSAAIRNVAGRIGDAASNGEIVAVVSAMGDTTDRLIALANEISDDPEPRELDVLQSTGELVSCTLVAMALRARGNPAISLSGAQAGIRTDATFGKAKITDIDAGRVREELGKGHIVVVAGFQGMTESAEVTTLGRGASDISAVALAAALSAERCEVYTDVDGIYTADPRLVPDARKLDEIGYEEMLELASAGAKMAPRSIEMGMVYGVPIYVASSSKTGPGTLIHEGAVMSERVGETRNRVRSVATDGKVAKITVLGIPDRPGGAAEVFEPLADADISVDVIVQSAVVDGRADLTFTVAKVDLSRAEAVVRGNVEGLGATGLSTADDLAKVSIVGTGMQDAPGYASRMFAALSGEGINIDVITTSEIRITCVIPESRLGDAARALHKTFLVEGTG